MVIFLIEVEISVVFDCLDVVLCDVNVGGGFGEVYKFVVYFMWVEDEGILLCLFWE